VRGAARHDAGLGIIEAGGRIVMQQGVLQRSADMAEAIGNSTHGLPACEGNAVELIQ
jgi:hypothetical protein